MRIIYLKMIILQYIKDCFKRICFHINLPFFCCVQLFITDWLGVREMRNMRHTCKSNTCYPVLFPLCSDVSCQLLCTLCAKQNSASRSWCFAAVCGWVSSPVMSLYYRLSALLHTDPRSAPVHYSGQIEGSHSERMKNLKQLQDPSDSCCL